MTMDFICKNYSYKLRDAGQNQIRMQCFFILGTATGKTEIFFDVINISFNNGSYFVSVVLFLGAAKSAGICM